MSVLSSLPCIFFNLFFCYVEHMFLLSARKFYRFYSFLFSQLYVAPSYKKTEVIQSDSSEFVYCHSYEPHTFTPYFSAFTVYLWDSGFLRHRNVRVTVWLSVKVLWVLNLSCQTDYSPKGNGIIIPPLKVADHRYLPVSGSLCVKINASFVYGYFIHKYWAVLKESNLT